MADIDYYLGLKYALLKQQADADSQRADAATTTANSGANFDNVRAGLLPAESKANIGLTGAQTTLAGANARNVDETTKYTGLLARASANNSNSQSGLYRSQTAQTNQDIQLQPGLVAAQIGQYGLGGGGVGYDPSLSSPDFIHRAPLSPLAPRRVGLTGLPAPRNSLLDDRKATDFGLRLFPTR